MNNSTQNIPDSLKSIIDEMVKNEGVSQYKLGLLDAQKEIDSLNQLVSDLRKQLFMEKWCHETNSDHDDDLISYRRHFDKLDNEKSKLKKSNIQQRNIIKQCENFVGKLFIYHDKFGLHDSQVETLKKLLNKIELVNKAELKALKQVYKKNKKVITNESQ